MKKILMNLEDLLDNNVLENVLNYVYEIVNKKDFLRKYMKTNVREKNDRTSFLVPLFEDKRC